MVRIGYPFHICVLSTKCGSWSELKIHIKSPYSQPNSESWSVKTEPSNQISFLSTEVLAIWHDTRQNAGILG